MDVYGLHVYYFVRCDECIYHAVTLYYLRYYIV